MLQNSISLEKQSMPLLAQNIVIDVAKWKNDNMVKNALLCRLFEFEIG